MSLETRITALAQAIGNDIKTKQDELTEGAFVDGDKTKLDGIAAGAEVNVQSDWNAVSGDSLILNKPTIPVVSDLAYSASWNGNTDAPSKNAVYDKIETISALSNYSITTSAAGNYTVLTSDEVILKTGITGGGDVVTLPSGAATGQVFTIKDSSGAANSADIIRIETAGTETIDGSSTFAMQTSYESTTFIFDGTNYSII